MMLRSFHRLRRQGILVYSKKTPAAEILHFPHSYRDSIINPIKGTLSHARMCDKNLNSNHVANDPGTVYFNCDIEEDSDCSDIEIIEEKPSTAISEPSELSANKRIRNNSNSTSGMESPKKPRTKYFSDVTKEKNLIDDDPAILAVGQMKGDMPAVASGMLSFLGGKIKGLNVKPKETADDKQEVINNVEPQASRKTENTKGKQDELVNTFLPTFIPRQVQQKPRSGNGQQGQITVHPQISSQQRQPSQSQSILQVQQLHSQQMRYQQFKQQQILQQQQLQVQQVQQQQLQQQQLQQQQLLHAQRRAITTMTQQQSGFTQRVDFKHSTSQGRNNDSRQSKSAGGSCHDDPKPSSSRASSSAASSSSSSSSRKGKQKKGLWLYLD